MNKRFLTICFTLSINFYFYFFKLLYKTEYQRNFVDYIRRAEPKPKSSEVNNKKSMDYSKQRVHEANVFDEKASPPQCSIGVQTDEKKVKFDLTPRNINTV